jgi:TolB-like protein
VRLKAQKLRWSLAKYYETDGRDDQVCISFRARRCQPLFSVRAVQRPNSEKAEPREDFPKGEVIPIAALERTRYSIVPEALVSQAPAKAARRRWLVWVAASVFFACSVVGAYLAGARRLPIAAGQKIDSIAVLPLRTAGGQAEFLSNGLTADLTDSLARIPGMGRRPLPSTEARPRGAGSIQQVGNRVRNNLLISDTGNGLPLWSAAYDQEVRDILQTQTDISESVTSAVRLRLAGAPGSELERASGGVAGIGAGEAHATSGEAYAIDFQWAKADAEFLKALELSPGRATVRRSYASYLQKTGQLSEAEAQIRRDPYTPSAVTLDNLGKNFISAGAIKKRSRSTNRPSSKSINP